MFKSGSYNHQMLGTAKAFLTRLRCNVNKLILTFLDTKMFKWGGGTNTCNRC